jgi:hypothetical protein
MELILNLVWVVLAIVFLGLWMRSDRRDGANTHAQIIALLMVIVIFFPVISVTDDLQALQNPAEIDCCARRYHADACAHSLFPIVATIPPPGTARLSFGFLRFIAPSRVLSPQVEIPALASIENRPPPTA